MTRVIEIRPKAEWDIRRNAIWLRKAFSARTADRWNDDIITAISKLTRRADQHPEADEAAHLGVALRCKLQGRRPHVFRVLFTLTDDAVVVHRVRHAAQDQLTEDDL